MLCESWSSDIPAPRLHSLVGTSEISDLALPELNHFITPRMTPPNPTSLTLDRALLRRAIEILPSLDLRILMYLVLHVTPFSNRVWRPLTRIADDLGLRETMLVGVIERLAALHFIEQHPPWIKNVLTIDIGPLLIRGGPENLPSE